MSLRSLENLLKQEFFLQYCLQSDPQAVAYWEDYIRSHPEEQDMIVDAKELFLYSQNLFIAEQYKPAAVAAMRQYLQENNVQKAKKTSIAKLISVGRWAAAAAIIGAIALTWWFMSKPKQIADVASQNVTQKAPVYFYDTDEERKAFTLSDGSFVLLEKGATLRIDSAFDKEERKVYLTGTGWFNVAKNKDHAFKVVTGNYLTTALGTAFRIQQKNNTIKVELEEGKVMVEKKEHGAYKPLTTLKPAESIELETAQKTNFSISQLKEWKAEEIVFDNTSISDVLQQLQQVYDLQISMQDKDLLKETFTGSFHQDAFTKVLDMICFSLKKQYKLTDGNKVLIY